MLEKTKPDPSKMAEPQRRPETAPGGRTSALGARPAAPSAPSASAGAASALRIMQLQQAYGNRMAGRALSNYLIQRSTAPPPPPPPPPAHGDPRLPASLPKPKKAIMQSMMGAHLRDFDKVPGNGSDPDKYEVNASAQLGAKIKYKTPVEIYTSIKDATGTWVLAKFDGKLGFLRENKVVRGLARAHNVMEKQTMETGSKRSVAEIINERAEGDSVLDTVEEHTSDALELLTTGPGGAGESLDIKIDDLDGKAGKEELLGKLKLANAGVSVGGFTGDMLSAGLSGLVGVKQSIGAIMETDGRADDRIFDGIEGGIDATKAVQEGVETSANFSDAIGKLPGTKDVKNAGAVGEWAGSVGEAISTVKSGFFIVKDIYDLFRKTFSAEGVSKDEVVTAGLSVISNSLQAAQGIVKTVKSILDIFKVGAAGLGAAIPGIGIAISGIQITIKVYEMIKSTISTYKMTKVKREFKRKYENSPGGYVGYKERKLFGKTLFKSFNKGTDAEKLKNHKGTIDKSSDEYKDIQEYELAEVD